MIGVSRAALAAAALLCGVTAGAAQVRYQPFPAGDEAAAYGYPVPGGLLQPNEVLGTSPSFAINPYAGYGQPVVTVTRRCQYPNGWNVTDFNRDVNGIPSGLDHVCPENRVRARY